jgi:hypothetical protein
LSQQIVGCFRKGYPVDLRDEIKNIARKSALSAAGGLSVLPNPKSIIALITNRTRAGELLSSTSKRDVTSGHLDHSKALLNLLK